MNFFRKWSATFRRRSSSNWEMKPKTWKMNRSPKRNHNITFPANYKSIEPFGTLKVGLLGTTRWHREKDWSFGLNKQLCWKIQLLFHPLSPHLPFLFPLRSPLSLLLLQVAPVLDSFGLARGMRGQAKHRKNQKG